MKKYVAEYLNYFIDSFLKKYQLKGKISLNTISEDKLKTLVMTIEEVKCVRDLKAAENTMIKILEEEILNENY